MLTYSLCCSDELPSLLTLPAVLATASSTQNLASLALLGKSEYHIIMKMMMMVMMMMMMMITCHVPGFWSYPMAACSRASVCGDTGDMETVATTTNNNGGPLTRTVSPTTPHFTCITEMMILPLMSAVSPAS